MSTNSNGNGHKNGKTTGRPCAICSHTEVKEINRTILERVSFRAISRQYGMNHASVARHAHDHLMVDLQAIRLENRIENAVDIELENIEQIEKAKQLRDDVLAFANAAGKDSSYRVAMDGVKTLDVVLTTQAKLKGNFQDNRPNDEALTGCMKSYDTLLAQFKADHEDREPDAEERAVLMAMVLELNGHRVDAGAFSKAIEKAVQLGSVG